MELLKFPHVSLFKPCEPITAFGEELLILLNGMWDVMIKHGGIGLSANQVDLPYRMFTMLGPDNEKLFIVNPKILLQSKTPANVGEGCLSAPGEFLVLNERTMWVQIMYQDETGGPRSAKFQGLHAVCVQHEMDHLDGKSHLQSKSLSRARRRELAKKWGIK